MVINNEVEIAIDNVEHDRARPQDREVMWTWLVQQGLITTKNAAKLRKLTDGQLAEICTADLHMAAIMAEVED